MTRPIRRIAVASGLAVLLIGLALAVTVWSYRNAVGTRTALLDAANERAASHAAETYLAREREAINEYFFKPSRSGSAKVAALEAGFGASMSLVGVGDAGEAPLVEAAGAANDEFLKLFARRRA